MAIFKLLIIALVMIVFHLAAPIGQKKHAMTIPPTVVEAIKVQAQWWQDSVATTGSLLAEEGTVLKSEVPGRVIKIFFKSGTTVVANTPLIQLDIGTPKAQLEVNKAAVNLSEKDYLRKKELHQSGVVSASDLDTATANYKADQARLAESASQLGKYYILAPFDGQLGLRLINLGDYIAAGTEIVSLQNFTSILIDFPMPEKHIAALKLGQKLWVCTDSYPNKVFYGEVIAIDSVITSNTQSLMVRGKIDDKEHKLIPGNFVNVTIYLSEPKKFIIIPQTALNYSPDGTSFVYRIIADKAVKTPVTILKILEQTAIIQRGINQGDVIVSSGGFKLRNNFPVLIAKKH